MLTKQDLNRVLNLNVGRQEPVCLIYSDFESERLKYVFKFVFNHVLGISCSVTNDIGLFESSPHLKINYSVKEIKGAFKIKPNSLLSENEIYETRPAPCFKNNSLYFFENSEENQGFHFDIFSAVFYFISRYEEWQTFDKDIHGRFEAKSSLLYKHQFHLKPLVDLWILEFKTELESFFENFKFPEKKMKILSTLDVDNLYAFKRKGIVRSLGATARDIAKLDFKNTINRILVLCGSKPDPFDVYEDVSAFCRQQNIPLFWFFLFRTGTKYDRTVNPQSPAFKEVFDLLKKNKAHIGLHPSYDSSLEQQLFEQEINLLRVKSGEAVSCVRQHFLRFDIRTTPLLMIKNGVIADFTMGFASSPGFRAGTSFPFYYYNFEKETAEELLFMPFCVMDGAFTIYEMTDPHSALKTMLEMAYEVKKVKGFFVSVFHERTFSDHLYQGFGTLYKNLHLKLKEL